MDFETGKIKFISKSKPIEIGLVQGHKIGHDFKPHLHHSFTFGILCEGKITLQSQEQKYSISPGQAYFIPPFTTHAIKRASQYYSHLVCCFQYKNKPSISNSFYNAEIKFWDETNTAPIYKYFNQIIQQQPLNNDISSIFMQLLNYLKDSTACLKSIDRPSKLSHSTNTALQFIQNNWQQDLDLTQIANSVNMSKYYFTRKFKAEIGLSPYDYLLQFRIKRSKTLLTDNLKITNIAHDTGFYDQSHFHKYFKKFVGVTPQEFRQYSIEIE